MSSTILNTSGTDTDSQVKICNSGICLTAAAIERNRLAQVGDDNHPRRLANAILAGLSKGYDLPLLCYYAESYWEYLPAGHPAGPVWVRRPNYERETLVRLLNAEADRCYAEALEQYHKELDKYNLCLLARQDKPTQAAWGGPDAREAIPKAPKCPTHMDTSRLLSGVQTQLRPLATVGPDTGTPGRPFWIAAEPDDPDPEYMIPLRNGLLDVSGEKPRLMTSNPRYWHPYVLPFDYDPDAPRPTRFLRILEDQFGEPGSSGEDREAKTAVLRWMALNLVPVTKFQKFALWHGATRSGRGTLLRILGHMLGPDGMVEKRLKALENDHAYSDLPGKLAITISDARTSDKWESDSLLSFLLTVTGEDALEINPKNRAVYTTRICSRITVLANKIPNIKDEMGALAQRAFVVDFPHTVPESEQDTDLEAAIVRDELPGILNVLLGHLRDVLTLPKHELFKIPQSAAHVVAHMNAHSNPALPFIEIGCAHPDGGSPLDKSLTEYSLEMYHGYRAYAHQMGVVCPLPLDKFNDLMAAGLSTLGVGFKKSRPKIWVGEGSGRHRTSGRETWTGVALTPTWAENGRAWARAHGDDHYKTEPETDPDVLQARLGAAQREVERLTTLLHRARKLGTP